MAMKNSNKNSGDGRHSGGIPAHFNPKSVSAVAFAKARAREIKTIQKDMDTIWLSQSPAQSLPKHMRRRAMSHDIKRLPCRLRRAAEHGMQKALAAASKKTLAKKGSRRHRRRPKNLREEFAKRQRDKVWLETHLWHAKRFKMSLQWGYKIPLHPCDKSLRAAYRATVRHCTIQDVSFYEVIEVRGSESEILQGLGQLTSSETGLTFGARMYMSGQHHGDVMLYNKGRYPYGAITRVEFVWMTLANSDGGGRETPPVVGTEEDRQLWMWVHPAAFMEALKAIKSVFESDSVKVNDLRGELTRLRLRGPHATAVVTDGLKVSSLPVSERGDATTHWWQRRICEDPYLSKIHGEQDKFWQEMSSIQSCTELPSRCVLGLTVRDPRALLPIQRRKVETDQCKRDPRGTPLQGSHHMATPTTDFSHPRCPAPSPAHSASHIWEAAIRDDLVSTMMPTHKINELRRSLLIPGSPLNLGMDESRVPVLLLQSPGVQRSTRENVSSAESTPLGFGCGWDVVLPKKWSPFFWVGFVYRGARAVGLKESSNTCLHQGLPRTPDDYPDTSCGRELEESRARELGDAFNRRPPAKRINYGKLGFLSPFKCPWEKLLSEWMDRLRDDDELPAPSLETTEEFNVLRNRTQLRLMQMTMNVSRKRETRRRPQPGHGSRGTRIPEKPPLETLRKLDQRALVWVRIDLLQKGSPEAFSMICLPKDPDLQALEGKRQNPEPQETLKKQFKLDRKQKKKKQKVPADQAAKKLKTEKTAQNERMTFDERVAATKLLDLNSRTIIGFVTNGGHVFSRGRGHAVGFCCLPGLLELAGRQSMHVLVRDTKSLQYRFANVTVMT